MFCKKFIQNLIETEKTVKVSRKNEKNTTVTKHFTHLILKYNTLSK